MKRMFFIGACLGLALATTGCKTLSDAHIGKTLCENQIASRAALNLKVAEDSKIKDGALRQAALDLDASLFAVLNACPVQMVPPAPNGSS